MDKEREYNLGVLLTGDFGLQDIESFEDIEETELTELENELALELGE